EQPHGHPIRRLEHLRRRGLERLRAAERGLGADRIFGRDLWRVFLLARRGPGRARRRDVRRHHGVWLDRARRRAREGEQDERATARGRHPVEAHFAPSFFWGFAAGAAGAGLAAGAAAAGFAAGAAAPGLAAGSFGASLGTTRRITRAFGFSTLF